MVRHRPLARAGLLLGGCSLVLAASVAAGATTPEALDVPVATGSAEVDGVLDEPFWDAALQVELEYEVRPAENAVPPVRTEVLLASSGEHLLIGFRAFDPEPQRIRARFRDRDNAWSDDFVGVVLDTFNDQRSAYELMVNPLGVQIDAINDEAGGRYDVAWDAIWLSAGRITADGYEVELAIPFDQLSFQPSEQAQLWGFDAIRSYPRGDRHHIGFFPRQRGQNSYLGQARKLRGFAAVEAGRDVQIVPTVTSTRVDRRGPDGGLEPGSEEADLGVTGRWRMASNWTLSGTVNPDFSQVEADVLQLDVNQQFTLFFPETRPFFLEGADAFSTPLELVHTRTVGDPSAAFKVTGKQGRHTVGVFTARDEVTNLLIPGSQGSRSGSFDLESTSSAARYRYDLGGRSTIGLLLTDRRADGYENQVGGVDLLYRPSDRHSLRLHAVYSDSVYSDEMVERFGLSSPRASGHAIDAGYRHSRRSWGINANFVDRGEQFRADLGFLTQVDLRGLNADAWYVWHGEEEDPYNRLSMAGWVYRNERQSGELLEEGYGVNFEAGLARETQLNLHLVDETRRFAGRDFEILRGGFSLGSQPTSAIGVGISGNLGDWIDFAGARPADRLTLRPRLTLALGRRFASDFVYNYSTLEIDEGRLFTARAPELRLLYYLNRRFYTRLIGQYTEVDSDAALGAAGRDPETRDLLGQLLVVYEVSPQTALYVGYGDTFDDRPDQGGPVPGVGPGAPQPEMLDPGLRRSSRTFFVKLGYAWMP